MGVIVCTAKFNAWLLNLHMYLSWSDIICPTLVSPSPFRVTGVTLKTYNVKHNSMAAANPLVTSSPLLATGMIADLDLILLGRPSFPVDDRIL